MTGIAYDSRSVKAGDVFVALKGLHTDGTAFARQAIERGAAAIVSEQTPPEGQKRSKVIFTGLRKTSRSAGI